VQPFLFFCFRFVDWIELRMTILNLRRRRAGRRSPLLLAGLLLWAVGCSGAAQTATQALERQYQENPQLQRPNLAKFAGRVTVDGGPPAKGTIMVVILHDRKQPYVDGNKPRQYAVCQPGGQFQFSTSLGGDGTLTGSYVVAFAQLHPRGKRGFFPPDELKNLYNDPEVNVQKPEFVVELNPPGKTDYEFDLNLAGLDPVAKPGPHATTTVER
jgi:hypothetical protein